MDVLCGAVVRVSLLLIGVSLVGHSGIVPGFVLSMCLSGCLVCVRVCVLGKGVRLEESFRVCV